MSEYGEELTKDWFEFNDHRRRRFSRAAWIPVYGTTHPTRQGKYPDIGHVEEMFMAGSSVIFQDKRQEAEKISDWHDWAPKDTPSWISDDGNYYEAGAFLGDNLDRLGFRLVLSQSHNDKLEIIFHQDFILAYGLLKEGNVWLRPCEGYEEVARQKANEKGEIILIEVRTEYLRDYLAARNAALRLYYYRLRLAILERDPEFDWPKNHYPIFETHDKCKVRCYNIDSRGDFPEISLAMFQARRTDVDPEEDIPHFSSDDEDAVDVRSWQSVRRGRGLRFRVSGEMWRGEWIEPAKKPYRILGEPNESLYVHVDASGEKIDLSTLVNDDSARYLWFKPEVIRALLSKRGARMKWYTKDTGEISASSSSGSLTHFGVNGLGYVNVITVDIAQLPLWERHIWVAHNCRPDGGVSEELMRVQLELCRFSTRSPECLLFLALKRINHVFNKKFGNALLRDHDQVSSIMGQIHRFRGVDENGLRSLAKDVVRISIERLNEKTLFTALGEEQSDLRSLKLLEKLLAKYTNEDDASAQMVPLFGVYDLRKTDAHLPSSKIDGCYTRLAVDRSKPYVLQAVDLLQSVGSAFRVIGDELRKNFKDKQ